MPATSKRRKPAIPSKAAVSLYVWHPGSEPELVETAEDLNEAAAIAHEFYRAEQAEPTGGRLLMEVSPPAARRTWTLFAAWSDVTPELIGVFEGTETEVQAWCAGFTHASRASVIGGDAVTLEQIMADPAGHGLKDENIGRLCVCAKGGA